MPLLNGFSSLVASKALPFNTQEEKLVEREAESRSVTLLDQASRKRPAHSGAQDQAQGAPHGGREVLQRGCGFYLFLAPAAHVGPHIPGQGSNKHPVLCSAGSLAAKEAPQVCS